MTLNLDNQVRELDADEILVVSGAKGKKTGGGKTLICTTVWYDDGSSTRTCVPEKK
jgi:hypothetical protein